VTIRAVLFDLYGTLLDIDRLGDRAKRYVDPPHAFVLAWRQKQLEYAFTTSLVGRYENFDTLTERSLSFVAERFKLKLDAVATRELLDGWLELPPHIDASTALDAVAAGGHRRIVLTNGVPESAHQALAAGGIGSRIDEVLSVGTNRVYKPAPEAYRVATAHLRCEPNDIVFVSSNGWDAAGAASFGFRVVWCNRTGAPSERIGAAPIAEIRALTELAPILAALA